MRIDHELTKLPADLQRLSRLATNNAAPLVTFGLDQSTSL
jgi:hypothetical protein